LGRAGQVTLFCGGAFFAGVAYLVWSESTPSTVSSVEFGPNRVLKLDDGEVRAAHGLYYQVCESGRVVIPRCHFAAFYGERCEVNTFFADGGRLAAALVTIDRGNGEPEQHVIIYDAALRESYPRAQRYASSEDWRANLRKKWADRYERLKQANPTLPESDI
jgi:hypothetical protein